MHRRRLWRTLSPMDTGQGKLCLAQLGQLLSRAKPDDFPFRRIQFETV